MPLKRLLLELTLSLPPPPPPLVLPPMALLLLLLLLAGDESAVPRVATGIGPRSRASGRRGT